MRLAICSVLIGLMGVVASLGGEPEMPRVLKGHNSSVNCVVFSPDSKLLASASAGDVRLWDVASEKTPCPSVLYRDSNYFNSLAFSPDGKILAGGSECRWIWLWDVRARIRITTTDTRAVDSRPDHSSCVAFRPDGKTLASWSSDFDGDDQAITLWDVATHKNTGRIKVKLGRGMWFVFSPDCKIFAVGNFVEGDKRVELYDTATGKKRATLKVDARDHAFSRDGKTLALVVDPNVELWDVATSRNTATLTGSARYVCGVAFSPDGKTLASGDLDGPVIELWDVASGKTFKTLKGHAHGTNGTTSLSFSPDGKMLAVGRSSGDVRWDEIIEIWDIQSAQNSAGAPSSAGLAPK